MDQGSAELHKLFYRIGEVAEIVGVEPHVLRFWETEFRSIRPQKSRKGQRIYSRRDVEKLIRVKDLLYVQGFTIAGARKRLREVGAEPGVVADTEGGVEVRPAAAALPPVDSAAVLAAAAAQRQASELRAILGEVRGEIAALLAELDADTDAE